MIKKTCIFSILCVLAWMSGVTGAERTALVIGNSSYRSAALDNSVNDARDMAGVLEKIGFEVILELNADKKTMLDSLRVFGRNLESSKIGLFYYAGHGIQIKGVNFLVPVKNQIRDVSEVEFESIDAGRVLAKMENAGNPMNILILDACRDNPFKVTFRTTAKGLARMDAPPGTILAYSTSPGSVSADGQGRNGLYTEILLKHIQTPDLHVRDMFNRTGLQVMEKTGNKQVPWLSASPLPDFYLAGRSITVVSPFKEKETFPALEITSDPVGAGIHINGKYSGITPLEISGIQAGEYTVRAGLDGYLQDTKTITVKEGGESTLNFLLETENRKAKLYVACDPVDCRVRILNILPAYYNGIPLDPGRYKLEISKPGFIQQIKWIEIGESSKRFDVRVSLGQEDKKIEPRDTDRIERSWIEPVTGMKFVRIPSGCYQMGNPYGRKDEKPVHKACVGDFWMGKYEVTRGQFKIFVQKTGYRTDAQKTGASYVWTGNRWERKKQITWKNLNYSQNDDHPVVSISWNDARAFANWMSRISPKKVRLPREAEWEYAARSRGRAHTYSGGSDIYQVAWFGGNSDGRTHLVGTREPNDLELYDMSGNAWEWCEDSYDKNAYAYRLDHRKSSAGNMSEKILRGGSWNDVPRFVRTTVRNSSKPAASFSDYGFRLIALP